MPKKQKNKSSKSSLRTKKSSSRFFDKFVTLSFIALILMVGTLFIFDKKNAGKSYKPELEKKLDMKAIPPDVKTQLESATPAANFRVPILMYHYVENVKDKGDTIRISLNTPPSVFELELIALKSGGYTFMTAGELGKVLDGQMKMPKNPILLTFDDGHRDFYTDVLPLLEKYNIKATAYVIPGFLGGTDFMDPDQVTQVVQSRLVEVASHTVNHVYLEKANPKTVTKEVDDSKVMLQNLIHAPVTSFAYPYGAFDKNAIETVKNAGYTNAVSTLPGIEVNQNDRYFIQRIRPGGRTGENLLNFLRNYTQPSSTSVRAASE